MQHRLTIWRRLSRQLGGATKRVTSCHTRHTTHNTQHTTTTGSALLQQLADSLPTPTATAPTATPRIKPTIADMHSKVCQPPPVGQDPPVSCATLRLYTEQRRTGPAHNGRTQRPHSCTAACRACVRELLHNLWGASWRRMATHPGLARHPAHACGKPQSDLSKASAAAHTQVTPKLAKHTKKQVGDPSAVHHNLHHHRLWQLHDSAWARLWQCDNAR